MGTACLRAGVRAAGCLAAVLVTGGVAEQRLPAQPPSIQVVTQRPFVIGFRPVVNNGAVGGVAIDAQGVIARANVDAEDRLRAAREKALQPIASDLEKASELRKVSLRGLEATIAELRLKNKPIPDELQNLAGLHSIRYVFVDRERRDIVLAGPAEGWKVGPQGAIVGRSSGQPILQLDDLVFALRTAEAAREAPITCSIDPTREGVQRFTRLARTPGLAMNEQTLRRFESALGPQRISIEGVPVDSRFARVMVAADYLMKRLAMGFERSPVAGLPSYLELVQRGSATPPQGAMPRWWLAPNYRPLLHDAEGLAWELRGEGVQVLAEDTHFAADGTANRAGKAHPLAKEWAEAFTAKYGALSGELPVLAELRNCMDLAVAAALIVKHDLPNKARFGMPLLLSKSDVQAVNLEVPKTIPAQANFIKKGGQWVITVSGGVEINSWAAADNAEADPKLSQTRRKAAAADPRRWWWD